MRGRLLHPWDADKYKAHVKENLADAAEAMAFLATYQIG